MSKVESATIVLPSQSGSPTWELADALFPRQGEWTVEEYLAIQTNRLIEFTDGHLEFLEMPSLRHQLIVAFLFEQLKVHSISRKLGIVCFSPMAIRVARRKFREPDVMLLNPGQRADDKKPPVGAQLVMEVISPGLESRERDEVQKRREYARAGIKEYWIVDPENETITILALKGSRYVQQGPFETGEQATSRLLPGFEISVSETFQAR